MGIIVKEYPFIQGEDAAGEVVAVGSNVTKFRKGDRVVILAGQPKIENGAIQQRCTGGAFQLFVVGTEPAIAKIPDNVSCAEACVLPLGLTTAAASLFEKDTLALTYPQHHPKPVGKVVLIWGGGSSVGSCGIQMVKAAGYEVASTASGHNLGYLKELGADYVFDYKSESVVDDIVSALKGKSFAGAFASAMDPTGDQIIKCTQVASRLGGNKFVATVLPPLPVNPAAQLPKGLPEDVKIGYCLSTGVAQAGSPIGQAIWAEWLPAALEKGSMKCKPDRVVFGQGLESIQGAVDRWREGVSAQKIVVELS